jgi:3-phenylpropionate/trans-cinnamate dioxygenase ferredoxin subunit
MVTLDVSALRDDWPTAVYPKGVGILLIKRGSTIHAVRNACAHLGCPLEAGSLDGDVLTCPCHDWRFDIRSGAMIDAPELGLPTYRTRIDDGKVLVELHGEPYSQAAGGASAPGEANDGERAVFGAAGEASGGAS